MFNNSFYPTPKNIISKMVSKINRSKCEGSYIRVLEPSAGKGNILDYLNEDQYRYELYCIESNSELCGILRDKKYNVVDDDFLQYDGDLYDVIIMNPPFENGSKHFLKAWEISSNTQIICLLNSETINNPYTKERKLIQKIINDNNGEVEELGQVFKESERYTPVNVCLVSIYKEVKNEFNFKPNKFIDQEKQYSIKDINSSQIANVDVFGNMEIRYNKLREYVTKMIELKNEMLFYGSDLIDTYNIFDLFSQKSPGTDKELYNDICIDIRKQSWKSLFNNTKMGNIVTSKSKEKIQNMQDKQGYMSFTARNMENLYSDLFQNMGNIMQDCVIESFDLLTKYHKENRCHVEGWKTNERFYINQKFILPNCVDISMIRFSKFIRLNYHYGNDITDIEKALCFLSGKKIDEIESIEKIFQNNKVSDWGKWYDSEFLEFKVFRKGTIHFKFKEESLWSKFNISACKGKNWIGC